MYHQNWCSLILSPNLSPYFAPNLVITEFVTEFGDKFGAEFVTKNVWSPTSSTVVKSYTNAISVTTHLETHNWEKLYKCTVEKSQTNAASAIMHLLGQVI